MTPRRRLLLILALVVLLRLPFLNQPIQGDDVNYLAGAAHAQIDPLHPQHVRYIFQGQEVDMRGHPHPPLNSWILGGLVFLCGGVREVPFHLAYLGFSLIAVAAMWSLARRFTSQPHRATLLFALTPALVVNGTSLEADLPLLAFWMAGFALFVKAVDARCWRALTGAVAALALAALAGFQAVVAIPILALYLWRKQRRWMPGWAALLTPALVLGGWQAWERVSSGALPAAVLAGYLQTYDLQSLTNKLRNAAALTAHLGWVVFPALPVLALRLPKWAYVVLAVAAVGAALVDPNPLYWASACCGLIVVLWLVANTRVRAPEFLVGWALIYFAAALVLFFAGSARYLLPMVAPVAMLVANELPGRGVSRRFFAGCVIAQGVLALSLAVVNYQHWNGYRRFVAELKPELASRRVWINGEFGLRFYGEQAGALPAVLGQAVRPGEMVLSSEMAYPIRLTTGGGRLTTVRSAEIDSLLPLRLIALNTRSGYSTASMGLRPFDIAFGPIDRVRADLVVERKPRLWDLPMNSPEAENQIVSGVYDLEANLWRWMAPRAVVLLRRPPTPMPVAVKFFLPGQSPARRVTVKVDGKKVAEAGYARDGLYTLVSPGPVTVEGDSAMVEVETDGSFTPPNDRRQLGMVLHQVGFRN